MPSDFSSQEHWVCSPTCSVCWQVAFPWLVTWETTKVALWSLLADSSLTPWQDRMAPTKLIKNPMYVRVRALRENYSLWRQDKILNRSENAGARAKESVRKMYPSVIRTCSSSEKQPSVCLPPLQIWLKKCVSREQAQQGLLATEILNLWLPHKMQEQSCVICTPGWLPDLCSIKQPQWGTLQRLRAHISEENGWFTLTTKWTPLKRQCTILLAGKTVTLFLNCGLTKCFHRWAEQECRDLLKYWDWVKSFFWDFFSLENYHCNCITFITTGSCFQGKK